MSISVLRICHAHSDAPMVCRFAHQLTIRSGVRVGARWSTSAGGHWQIVWYDGPTVIAMRRHAAGLGQAIVGVDLDHLTWQRICRAQSHLQLIGEQELVGPPKTPAA